MVRGVFVQCEDSGKKRRKKHRSIEIEPNPENAEHTEHMMESNGCTMKKNDPPLRMSEPSPRGDRHGFHFLFREMAKWKPTRQME